MYKRIIASALAVVIFFSVFSAPKAKAIDPVSVGFLVVSIGHLALDAYRTWRAEHPSAPDSEFPGYDPGGVVSSEDAKGGHFSSSGSFGTAYDAYVETLPVSAVSNDGAYILSLPVSGCSLTGNSLFHPKFVKINDYTCNIAVPAYSRSRSAGHFNFSFSAKAPFDGFVSIVSYPVYSCQTSLNGSTQYFTARPTSGSFSPLDQTVSSSGSISFGGSVINTDQWGFEIDSGSHSYYFVIGLPRVKLIPFGGDIPSVMDTSADNPYAPATRPASITGNYGVITESGDVQQIESQTIVNEGDHSVYNPVTNTTYDMQDWNYDYSDRSYHITTTEGDTVTVTYGDEHVTINEGGETYNVYYIVSNSGSSSGTGSDGSDTGSGSGTGTGTGAGGGGGGSFSTSGTITHDGTVRHDHSGTVHHDLTIEQDEDTRNALVRFFSAIAGWFESITHSGDLLDTGGDDSSQSVSVPASDGQLQQYVQVVRSWGTDLQEVYSGYVGFLSDLFPYLPPELLDLFYWGLGAVVFLGVFRRFVWR